MTSQPGTTTVPTNRDDGPIEVVVLGGGYTAVWGYRAMARRLRRRIRAGTVRITVVSASTTHAFHGWTGDVLAGLVDHDRTRTPLDELLPRARLVHGRAEAVDLDERTVTVTTDHGHRVLGFDHLLVGVGSVDATTIPGLAEHGRSVKGEQALADTDRHLHEVVARAGETSDPWERRRLLTVVVAGGGFAGVEMAAAIAERFWVLADRHPVLVAQPPRVVLAHSGDTLLPELRPRFDRLADYATRQLVDAGVEIRLATRLQHVTDRGAVLDTGSSDLGRGVATAGSRGPLQPSVLDTGSSEPGGGVATAGSRGPLQPSVLDAWQVPAETVLSTVGQAMVPLAGTEPIHRDPRGRMVTDAWLRTSEPGVWAGGDTAAVPHVLRGTPCPPNALWAIKHGVRVGDNIARAIRGRRLRKFRFPGLGQAASLGVGRGAVELYGVTLTGWAGWLARWGFFHWFMPSRRGALATIRDWLALPRRGRFTDVEPVAPTLTGPARRPDGTSSEPAAA